MEIIDQLVEVLTPLILQLKPCLGKSIELLA